MEMFSERVATPKGTAAKDFWKTLGPPCHCIPCRYILCHCIGVPSDAVSSMSQTAICNQHRPTRTPKITVCVVDALLLAPILAGIGRDEGSASADVFRVLTRTVFEPPHLPNNGDIPIQSSITADRNLISQ